jgi:ankyrin repeat protein
MKQGRDHACTRHLLELGANPSQPDAEGRTALHMFYNACSAYMFLYHPEDIDTWAQDKTGKTVLHYMAWSSQSAAQELIRCTRTKEMPQLLVKDLQGKSILHYATQRGNIDLIDFLLARPEVATLCMPDYYGRTLLHHATESGRVSTIDLFLARDFDPDALDNKGHTILHHACRWGNVKAVKHLVDLGFTYQLDVVDHEKRTPFQLAEYYRSKAVILYLQQLRPDKGASFEKRDKITVVTEPSDIVKLKLLLSSKNALVLLLLVLFILYGVWRYR